MSNFKPAPRSYIADIYATNNAKMEGEKANFTTALLATESCMKKCGFSDASPQISETEGSCMRQCFVKYFDCELLL